ncbi:hypothetical protein [Streptomyces sp. NPDC050738]|uniref:hypothetical protein n=1 Tax=Streptomyces sp. NPDC050738 TaxID=3154744 RepID=UPI00343B25C7
MAEQPLNRAQRRSRKAALIAYVLDGPKPKPICGQAKAAARRRTRAEREAGGGK